MASTKRKTSTPLADTGIDWSTLSLDPAAKQEASQVDAEPSGMMRRYLGDTAASVAKGAVMGVRMLTDTAGADNSVSTGLRSVEGFIGGLQSAEAKKDQQEIARILNEAEGKGVLDQVVAGARAFGVAPMQTMAQAAGTSIPTIAAALIPGVGPAAVATRFAAPLALGAAQGAGAVKSSIYDEVKQRAIQEGRSPAEAEQLAVQAQDYSSANGDQIALGAGLGAWAGKSGLESAAHRLVHGTGGKAVPGMVSRVATGAVAEGIPEAAQGGQEKYASNVAQQNAGFQTDAWSGVAAGATMEGLAGHAMGAAMGIPAPGGTPPVVDPAATPPLLPETGPMSRAANAATIAARGQQQLRVSNESIWSKLPNMSLENAQRIEAQAAEQSKDLIAIDHPFGGYTVVPRQVAAEIAMRNVVEPNPDAMSDMPVGPTSTAEDRAAERARVEQPREPRLDTSATDLPLQAIQPQGEFDRSQFPVAEPLESMTPKGTFSADRVRASALAGPVPTLTPRGTFDPLGTAERVNQPREPRRNTDGQDLPLQTVQPIDAPPLRAMTPQGKFDPAEVRAAAQQTEVTPAGLILNREGEPFKTQMAAAREQKKHAGSEVVAVPGGHAVQPATVENTNAQVEQAAVPEATSQSAVQEGNDSGSAVPAGAGQGATGVPAAGGVAAQADGVNEGFTKSGWTQFDESSWQRGGKNGIKVSTREDGRLIVDGYERGIATTIGEVETKGRSHADVVAEVNRIAVEDEATFTAGADVAVDADGVIGKPKKPPFASKEDMDHLFGVDKRRPAALERIAAGKAWFSDGAKAKDFITKSGLSGTHTAAQGKGGRWDVVANGEQAAPEPAIDRRNRLKAERVKATKAKKKAGINDDDTLLQAVTKMGGIQRAELAREFGMTEDEFKLPIRAGNMQAWPFRVNGGLTIDSAAEQLKEAGYFDGVPDDEIRGKLEEAIFGELGGSPRLSTRGQMTQADRMGREDAERNQAEEAAADPFKDSDERELQAMLDRADLTDNEVAAINDSDIPEFDAPFESNPRALADFLGETYNEATHGTETKAGPGIAQAGAEEGRGNAGAGAAQAPRAAGEEARNSAAPSEGLTLSTQSQGDLKAKVDRESAALAAEKAQKAAEQARLSKQSGDRENKQRADQTVDDFELGQSADKQMSGMGDLFDAPATQKSTSQQQETADPEFDAELQDALGKLGDVLGDLFGGKMNMMPAQYGAADLLPALSKVVELLVRKGFKSFAQATTKAAQVMRANAATAAHVDAISPRQWKAAYNAIADSHEGTDSEDVLGALTAGDVKVMVAGKTEAKAAEGQRDDAKPTLDGPEGRHAIAQSIADHLIGGGKFATIIEARKLIENLTGSKIPPGTKQAKLADETVEVAIVLAGREMVSAGHKQGRSDSVIYDRLLSLHDAQPSLNVRDSLSIKEQAYSTPVPLAFVGSRLAGIKPGDKVREPTGGNGILLIEVAPSDARVNELNADRLGNLKAQGFEPTNLNAATAVLGDPKVDDAQIMNPPFGAVSDENGNTTRYEVSPTYTTREVDHAIVFNSLASLKDDGSAVLIIGGPLAESNEARKDTYRGKSKREFFFNLYAQYNVVDHMTISGDLYSKQGASFPVDMIVIRGRGKSQRSLPAAQLPALIGTWEQLREKLDAKYDDLGTQGSGNTRGDTGRAGASSDGQGVVSVPAAQTAGQTGPGSRAGGTGASVRTSDRGGAVGLPTGPLGERGQSDGAGEQSDAATPGQPGNTGNNAGKSDAQLSKSTDSNRANKPAGLDNGSGVGADRAGLSDEDAGKLQVKYKNFSGNKSVNTLVATNHLSALQRAFDSLRARVGNIDAYVQKQLEYDDAGFAKAFSAEQVEALALAIDNIEQGKGFIIGDQTGIGKGRVVAAMIRYAKLKGKTPVFVTQMPDLYGDMMRDLSDIGMPNIRPLMTNNDAQVPLDAQALGWFGEVQGINTRVTELEDEIDALVAEDLGAELAKLGAAEGKKRIAGEARVSTNPEVISLRDEVKELKASKPVRRGKFLDTPPIGEHEAALKAMVAANSIGEHDVVFTTYNQMAALDSGKPKTDKMGQKTQATQPVFGYRKSFLDHFVNSNAMLILDESHNAGEAGDGNFPKLGDIVRSLIAASGGVFYSSATFAKNPAMMDAYSKTDLGLAFPTASMLTSVIRTVPLQQVTSSMLVEAGQYLRRERSFEGITYDSNTIEVSKEAAEGVSEAMRLMVEFDRAKASAIADIQNDLDAQGSVMASTNGGGSEAAVDSTNFTSTMHNVVNTFLLALKADAAASTAIKAIQAGEKPVITVANTMEMFITEYSKAEGLGIGSALNATFADVLLRYLDKTRWVQITDGSGNKERHYLSDSELGSDGVDAYQDAKDFIDGLELDVPLSPIDHIKQRIQEAGYSIGEITGRQTVVENGILRGRNKAEMKTAGKKNTIAKFNGGSLDALIINRSGSTGLSMHASETFDDQRRRMMIVAQAELDINNHMQMLGRINRTGQVTTGPAGDYKGRPASYGLPRYEQLTADVPIEMRPAAVLANKMAGLNANTTAGRKSAVESTASLDFMNKYGDRVAALVVGSNSELNLKLGNPVRIDTDGAVVPQGAMAKVTGRIGLLSLKEQTALYEQLGAEYTDLITQLDALGQNDLEAKTYPLDAKTIETKELVPADAGQSSVFTAAIHGETVDMRKLGKPYPQAKVNELIADSLDGKNADQVRRLTIAGVTEEIQREINQLQIERANASVATTSTKAASIAAIDKKIDALRSARLRFADTLPTIGQTVVIKTDSGNLYGVATSITKPGKTKSAGSLSAWKVKFAVVDGARSLSFPLTQIYTSDTSILDAVVVQPATEMTVANAERTGFEVVPVMEAFDRGQVSAREQRTVITGNILRASSMFPGRLINYTDDKGGVKQGILMVVGYDLSKATVAFTQVLSDPAKMVSFIENGGEIVDKETGGKVLTVTRSIGGRFDLSASKTGQGKKIAADGGIYMASSGNKMKGYSKSNEDLTDFFKYVSGKLGIPLVPTADTKHLLGGPKPAFSRSQGQPQPASDRAQAVEALVGQITSRWKNAPEVVVVENLDDPRVPQAVRDEGKTQQSQGALGTPEGFFHGGKVYLVAPQLGGDADVVRVLFHEALGHFGLRGTFGAELGTILDRLAVLNAGKVRAKAKQYGLDYDKTSDRRIAAEEVLAEMAQRSPDIGWAKKAVAAIRTWLREHVPGFRKMAFSDAEIVRSFLLPARAFVQRGGASGDVGGTAFSLNDEKAARAALARIQANDGITSSGDLRDLLRVPGYSRWAKSPIVGDADATAALRAQLGERFGNVDWRAPKLTAQGAISIYSSFFKDMPQADLDSVVALADQYGVPVAIRSALTGNAQKLAGAGFVAYSAVQELGSASREAALFSYIRPGGGIGKNTPMFSRSTLADAVTNFSQAGARNAFLDAVTTHGSTNLWGRTVGTQYHKAQTHPHTFGRVFDAVQDYIKDTSVFANKAADLAPSLLPKLDTAADLMKGGLLRHGADPKDAAKAGEAIFQGTLGKELYSAATLRSRFGLNEKQIGLYREFRAAVDESLQGLGKTEILRLAGDSGRAVREAVLAAPTVREAADILTEHIASEGGVGLADPLGTAEQIGAKVTRIEQLQDEGYAPLTRFGKHTLHITGPDGGTEFFGMYESVRDANIAARQLRGDPGMAGKKFTQGVMSQEGHKLFNGLSMDSLELFADATGNSDNPVYQAYLKLAVANRSALKRMIERKGIAGYSDDVARVLASFVTSNARMSAGHLHLSDAKKSAEAIPKEQGDLRDDAIKLVEYVTNPAEEAAAVRGLLFTSFIGGSVASALVNMTQPITMTLPYLVQYGGAVQAGKRLTAAMAMVASGKGMDAGLVDALKRAEADGIVSPQEIHHLQGAAMDSLGSKYPALKKAAFVWGSMFSLAEQFNRRVSFVAAYKTAQQEGIGNPFAFAEKAVIETQGLYNKGNKAAWARGAVGATVMTFKQFSTHYLEFLVRMWKSGPEGKKAVAVALALLILTGGAGGLPFADDLDDLIDTLGQAMGHDTNSKRWKRQFVAQTLGLGDGAADVATRGLTALPGFPMDLSLRMGMGNLLPATGLFLRSNTDTARQLLEVAGAAGGLASNVKDGVSKVLAGDPLGGGMKAMPMAVQNAAKAVQMWDTGEYRNTKGAKVMNVDAIDGAMKFIGFQPAGVARESGRVGEAMRSIQLAKNVEGEIAGRWAQAMVDGDSEGVAKARRSLAEWNADNPSAPIKITLTQVLARVKALKMNRADRTVKAAPKELRATVRESLS
jgi:hypothetical protein